MISVSRSSWMIWNSIKLVEITLPGTGFIASTKNRWDDDGRFVSELFKKAIESGAAIQHCQSRFQFGLRIFFSRNRSYFLLSVSPLGKGRPADRVLLSKSNAATSNSSSKFPTKRLKRLSKRFIIAQVYNLIDIDRLSNAIFLLSCKAYLVSSLYFVVNVIG